MIGLMTLNDSWFDFVVQKDQPLPLRIAVRLSKCMEYRQWWCRLIAPSSSHLRHGNECTEGLKGSGAPGGVVGSDLRNRLIRLVVERPSAPRGSGGRRRSS